MAILDSAGSNINIDGNVTSFTDFGGVDTYTILASLSANVTITDNNISRINLPEGLDVSAVSFLSDGVQFTVNGNTVTLLGNPAAFSFIFGGTPLDANAGTALDYQATATAFGTSVPTAGSGPNAASNVGRVNADGSVGNGTGGGLPVLPTINISPFGGQFLEGDTLNTQVTFTISLSEPSSNQVSVDYQTLSFAALSEDVALELYGSTAEADFIGANGTMIFAPGVTQQTFSIEILGDTRVEQNESFVVALDNPQGAILASSIVADLGTIAFTILDDDQTTSPTLPVGLDLSVLSVQQQIAAIYIGYFDRAADPFGQSLRVEALSNPNISLTDIALEFATQSEALVAYPFLSAPTQGDLEGFVAEIYLNLFNRAPDQSSLDTWSTILLNAINDEPGSIEVGEFILEIIRSAQNTANGNDRTTILNKIEVATFWTDAADAAGIDYASNTTAQNSAKTIIEGVTDELATVTAARSTIDAFFGGDLSTSKAVYFLLDTDAELAGNPNRLWNIDVDGIRFSIDRDNGPVDVTIESPVANVALTHQGFVNGLQAPLQALIDDGTLPVGTTLTLDPTIVDIVFLADGSRSQSIPAIVLTSGSDSEVIAIGFSRVEEPIGEYNVYSRFESTIEVVDQPTTPADDHSNNRDSSATQLALGINTSGEFERNGDEDVFRLDVVFGRQYTIQLSNIDDLGTSNEAIFAFIQNAGPFASESFFAAEGETNSFTFEANGSGTMYLELSNLSSVGPDGNTYSVVIYEFF